MTAALIVWLAISLPLLAFIWYQLEKADRAGKEIERICDEKLKELRRP